jgi:integrase
MPGHLYQRGNIWWIKFAHQGKNYYTSSKSTKKADATRLLSMYLGQIAAGTFQGLKPPQREVVRLPELLDDFEADCKRRKLRDLDKIISHLRPVRAFFKEMPITEITERQLDLFVKYRLAQGVGTTTVNRQAGYLLQALRRAMRKKLLTEIPVFEKFSEKDNSRQGFFAQEDFQRIVPFLPDDLQDFVRFAYYSGWRKGEIAQLEWTHIREGVIRLPPQIAKNKDGRLLVLVGEIGQIIERRRYLQRPDTPLVFYRERRGKLWPVDRFDKAWHTARTKAGVAEARIFHDFRRTSVRNMTRAGVPEKVAMQIAGHKTRAIFDRYNITNEEDIRAGQLKTERHLSGSDSLVTEIQKA